MFIKTYQKIIIFSLVFSLLLPSNLVWAAMQSSSYVIYENIHHTFDGPVISSVASSVSGLNATVTWTTSIEADSFVVYNTDSALPEASNKEQGSALKTSTSHSIVLSGLSANTTYYYRVKSTRINGGTSLSSTINSFSIGADPSVSTSTSETSSNNGGGILIIDKTDKKAPVISDLQVIAIDTSSAKISWITDEKATGFVEYGASLSLGSIYGQWSSSTQHEIILTNLKSEIKYYYRALSSDSWGNLGKSDILTFSLSPGEQKEEDITGVEETSEEEPEEELKKDEAKKEENILQKAQNTAVDFLRRLFPAISLNEISDDQLNSVDSLDDLSSFISAPILSGQPAMDIGATEVVVRWDTDVESNSQIAFAPADYYQVNAQEPYYQVVGSADKYDIKHEVGLYGLQPDTTYHFQLRSKPRIGQTALSRDYTFTTKLENLKIESFFAQIISNEKVIFKWTTNKAADSMIKFAPYQNNIVALDQEKTVKDNSQIVIHEITLNNLEAGIYYDIKLQSSDQEGNTAVQTMMHFSTSEDDLPPQISHIKADSTVFLDKSSKTQTVISWISNEPSTSRVYFQEGVHGPQVDLSESTDLNTDFTKEHIMVITKFKPGMVYSFRVESVDSGGNTSLSKVHTFMTAKQKQSIIQIIIGIFEDTFGWVKKIM